MTDQNNQTNLNSKPTRKYEVIKVERVCNECGAKFMGSSKHTICSKKCVADRNRKWMKEYARKKRKVLKELKELKESKESKE